MSFESITSIIHRSVLKGEKPAKVVADEVGKPYSTFLREINPKDGYGKLGVDTFLRIMQVTKDIEPLRVMADRLGYTLEPKPGGALKPVRRRRRKNNSNAA